MALGCILVVDDSDGVRVAYTETLRQRSYEVVEAVNGEESLAILRKVAVEVAIIDVRMPIMGGFELRQRLLEVAPQSAPSSSAAIRSGRRIW